MSEPYCDPPCRYPFDKDNCRGCGCGNCAMRRREEEYDKERRRKWRAMVDEYFEDVELDAAHSDSETTPGLDRDVCCDEERISYLEASVSALRRRLDLLEASGITYTCSTSAPSLKPIY